MSKVRVDQLSPTDDSVTVNVKDLGVINNLTGDDSLYSNILNVAQAIKERKSALNSNTIRLATWNIQSYFLVNPVPDENAAYADTRRFNRNFSSQQFVREHIEWLLKLGVDFVAIQEFYGRMATKVQWEEFTSVGSNWRMYPYVDSYMALETINPTTLQRNHTGGNLSLSTRDIISSAYTLLISDSTAFPVRPCGRTEISVNGVSVVIFNVHTNGYSDYGSDQLNTILGLANAETASHIVLMGDWNMGEDSNFAVLTDAGFVLADPRGGGNVNGDLIDRIFYKGFSAVGNCDAASPPYELGDHQVIYCDLTI